MANASEPIRALIVSGPSCAGKSPLCAVARRQFPQLFEGMSELVLMHSRDPRPDERDGEHYRFRSRDELEQLRDEPNTVVWEVRDDLMALELGQLDANLESARVLFEGDYRVALDLLERCRARVSTLGVFVSPLSRAEVAAWRADAGADFDARVLELMRRRLLRRARREHDELSQRLRDHAEARAADALAALRTAHCFDHVLPNHDGEDSDHWWLGDEPIGDARRSVEALCELLEKGRSARVERWTGDVID